MVQRRRRRTSSSATLCGPAPIAAWQQSELLEERTLLSNLAITDAFLVDGNRIRVANPVIGEQLEVRSSYTTTALSSSAAYAIRVIVDGIAIDRAGVDFGAGIGSGIWLAGVLHGYAEPGTHTVQVILDALNQVAEDNENDNSFTFSMTPASAADFPQKLGSFVTGTAGVDWRIINFTDLDPRFGSLRDYRGGQFTYDVAGFNHDAIDLGTGRFSGTDAGMAILAAADGVVESVHDGEFDRITAFASPVPVANFVIVNHGNGWRSAYWHLRRDSVSVKTGDTVKAGDILGWMGSSGQSTGPHVHFEISHYGHPVETMLDTTTFWVTPPAYPADYRHVISSGFTTQVPTNSEWGEQPSDIRTFIRGGRVYFWIIAGAMMPNDIRTVRFYRPDGTVFFEREFNQSSVFYQTSQWNYSIDLPTNAPLGTWTATWLQNNVELARQTFDVATTGVPELRVEQSTNLIIDQRFTPINFGTSPVGSTAPTQSFTMTNQGSAALSLGTITAPAGFQVVTVPAPSLAPGQTTTLTVRLLTDTAGYFAGELRMATNDPDESSFRIWLEGIVETPGTATLIPGISVRKAAEGSKFFANVRRTGSTVSPATVTLLSSDTSELAVPSTVTIPSGASFVNFEVQAVHDFMTDGDQRVLLSASATGLTSGQNEVLILDKLVGRLIVAETGGFTVVSEGGAIDQISVALSVQPTSDVVINVSTDDASEVTPMQTSIVFTPANWSTPQLVTIAGADDRLIDGTQSASVRFAVNTASSDSVFADTPTESIFVTNDDNDVAGFEIQQSGGSTIAREQTFTDSIFVRLTAQPDSKVVLSIVNPAPAELGISIVTVTITPAQWDTWQPVTFSALADGISDGDNSNVVTISVSDAGSDDNFDALPNQFVTVITEDRRPDYLITESAGRTVVGENGLTDTVTLTLTVQPTGNVVIRAELAVTAEITLSQTSWTFDESNWNVGQTLQLSAIDDLIEELPELFEITFSVDVAASDQAFATSIQRTVSVTVEDDEPAPPRILSPGTAILDSPLTFSWTAVPGATDYELWVNFASGNQPEIVHEHVNGTSFTVAGFNELGLYRAWVRATVASGFVTRWSPSRDVRVSSPIQIQPVPRYLNLSAPTFAWNPVPTAVRYDVWIDDVLNGRSQLIRRTDITETSFTVSWSLSMSLYRVWVRGIDARGEATNWSPRQEFFIATPPSTEPTALSTFDTTPTLRWEAVNGARRYEIWLRNMFTGADVTRVANITQTDWTAPAALPNARYQWWVRAFGDYNVTGLWSTGRMLWVGGQPANLNASVAPNARVSFQWGTVEGVFLYQLQVDRIDVPQTRVIREDSLLSNSFQTQFALSTGTYRAWVRAISSTGLTSFWSKEVMFTV